MNEPRETWHIDTARIGRVPTPCSLKVQLHSAFASARSDTDGLALVADFQTAGRGQYGRVWQSRPGSSLLMSVVLFPPRELCRPVILTAIAAVAVAEAVYDLAGVQSRVKWPNDLLVRGKKVCGLLIEQHASAVIVGIGLNLTQSETEFASLDLPDATSLLMLTDRSIDTRTAAESVLRHFDREYERLAGGELVEVEADWKWRLGLLGRQVLIETTYGSKLSGRMHEIGFDGLEVEVADGFFRAIPPETVSHVRAL